MVNNILSISNIMFLRHCKNKSWFYIDCLEASVSNTKHTHNLVQTPHVKPIWFQHNTSTQSDFNTTHPHNLISTQNIHTIWFQHNTSTQAGSNNTNSIKSTMVPTYHNIVENNTNIKCVLP